MDVRRPAESVAAAIALLLLGSALVAIPSFARAVDEPTELNDEDERFFETEIRPLLVEHCLECHSGSSAEGNLRLDTRDGWQAGGASGAAIVPGDAAASLLMMAVRRLDPDRAMPPDSPLDPADVERLQQWIDRGAPDPRGAEQRRVGGLTWTESLAWWSFQPLAANRPSPELPAGDEQLAARGVDSPIDAWLAATALERFGLENGSLADRRTLLRRATFDLTGLPPTTDDIESFGADERPDAFVRQVDRLLASHAYGERWGRHWLDLVRYADTAGENTDHPVQHAWRYRNWVIDAWNQDLPVDDFVRWQIAGDLIAAESGRPLDEAERGGPLVATGYLAIARRFGHDSDQDMHLTYEDTIDTLGKSLLGLTLGCARCHAHKYDPVSSEDYYALYGVLASTRFPFTGCEARPLPANMVPIVAPDVWESRTEGLAAERRQLQQRVDELQAELGPITVAARDPARRIELVSGAIDRAGLATWGPDVASSDVSASTPLPSTEIDVRAGDWIVLTIGPRGDYGADTTRVELTIRDLNDGTIWNSTAALVDDFLTGNPNPDPDGAAWGMIDARNGEFMPRSVRDLDGRAGLHVWRTDADVPSALVNASESPIGVWTTLPARTLFVHPSPTDAVQLAWIAPRDARVVTSGTVADAHPEGGNGVDFRVDRIDLAAEAAGNRLAALTAERSTLSNRLAELERMIPPLPEGFAVQEGVGHDEAIRIKGEPELTGAIAPRRFLEVLGGELLSDGAASGRRQLAELVTPGRSPLAARVWTNRLWLHLFGRGLVRTPNDFGTRGEAPTHPELLDCLAHELVVGESSKRVQRMIVLSHAYRREGERDDRIASIDPQRIGYTRFVRRRLSAEELRDALLSVTDALDTTAGLSHPFTDPSTWTYTQHNPFADEYPTSKRTVYVMTKRNRRQPFLALFDGADPSATTPQRLTTTVPTQALYFLNDPFFHERAAVLAERSRGDESTAIEARLDRLVLAALQRPAADAERRIARELIADWPASDDPEGAWRALARIVLGSNEFLYLD